MLWKKVALTSAAGATLLLAGPAFADPPHWAPAYGWRAKHAHYDRHYPYAYAPPRVVVVTPPVVYAPPPPVVYAPPIMTGPVMWNLRVGVRLGGAF